MLTEKTQFGMVEYKAFVADPTAVAGFRKTAMADFGIFADSDAGKAVIAGLGGVDNIQRVRVLMDDGGSVVFNLVPKLPPHIWQQKQRDAERAAVLAEVEKLKNDPVALREYVHEVAFKMLGRAALALLEASKKASKVQKVKAQVRNRVDRQRSAPKKRFDPYEAALAQDKKNRIEAAKKAAVEFNQTHPRVTVSPGAQEKHEQCVAIIEQAVRERGADVVNAITKKKDDEMKRHFKGKTVR